MGGCIGSEFAMAKGTAILLPKGTTNILPNVAEDVSPVASEGFECEPLSPDVIHSPNSKCSTEAPITLRELESYYGCHS